MKAIIYGGRDWDNQQTMNAALDRIHAEMPITLVLNGAQVSRRDGHLFGADWQADVWATSRGIPVQRFFANWTGEGKAAGPLRNQRMAEARPTLGVQFPGGKGTRDMRRRLDAAGVRVIEVSALGLILAPA